MKNKDYEIGMRVRMVNSGLIYDKGDIFTIKDNNPLFYSPLIDLGSFFCSAKNFEKVNY